MQCSEKPADPDKYGFSNFARMLMSGKGLNPLPSDSRRRPDRAALQVCPSCSGVLFSCIFGAFHHGSAWVCITAICCPDNVTAYEECKCLWQKLEAVQCECGHVMFSSSSHAYTFSCAKLCKCCEGRFCRLLRLAVRSPYCSLSLAMVKWACCGGLCSLMVHQQCNMQFYQQVLPADGGPWCLWAAQVPTRGGAASREEGKSLVSGMLQ